MSHLDVMSVLCVCDAIMLCCILVYCHYIMLHLCIMGSLSSLDKPLDGGPGDGPFYPTLTLMIESLIKSNELAQMCLSSLVTVYNS